MTINFGSFRNKTYNQLLMEVVPQVIETEEEYERILKVAEFLAFKKNLTVDEKKLDKLLVKLIEDYEQENYSMVESAPHEILQHIIESRGIQQADLVRILGSSSGVVSEMVNGKRSISKAHAKKLSAYFKVSAGLFI